MLPSEPKIFHGRVSELSNILQLLGREAPRIAILGTGGMGKTSLARAVLHHPETTAKYTQHRYFVACDSAANKVELAALIGAHLGLKPSKDLTQAVVRFFAKVPPSLLILDNLEAVWEPTELRGDVEELLSLLTDVKDLALIITMRGAERPAKVQWSHPFLLPLQPLKHHAAQQTLIDIAEDHHNPEDIDRVLSLTDNMPLAINLIANLVAVEGCSRVLSRWEEEKTSLISDGYDKRSNLDLSISLSLSSPRIKAVPHSEELLSLLSMLPDGLSDVELSHSNLPIDNILDCKTALIRTALAYQDEKKRLKALVPIREYMKKSYQPGHDLIWPLLEYFKELLELHQESNTTQMSSSAAQILSNFASIQNILQNGLQPNHPDLKDIVLCALHLNLFSRLMGRGTISFLTQLHHVLPDPCDHQLEAALVTELFASSYLYPISNPETTVTQALEHFEYFDDLDLKCRPTFYTLYVKTDTVSRQILPQCCILLFRPQSHFF
ncbi:P-loop containing nucleoside triphosphate hydrolase protein [Mycena leptocephala]|nr:P-loop containing nucleoside triphosphate hydrolase protein [Mycena leptocephala]